MNGKNHERLNILLLFPAIFFLGYHHLDIIFTLLFILKWFWNTYYVTPDIDTNSRPRKRLGVLGWIIDMIFGHRKTLHSPLFWAVLFAVEYYFIGAWTLGGVVPVASHLIADKF